MYRVTVEISGVEPAHSLLQMRVSQSSGVSVTEYRVKVMVLQSKGSGVTEKRLWYYL
jgi:hypothetical protein